MSVITADKKACIFTDDEMKFNVCAEDDNTSAAQRCLLAVGDKFVSQECKPCVAEDDNFSEASIAENEDRQRLDMMLRTRYQFPDDAIISHRLLVFVDHHYRVFNSSFDKEMHPMVPIILSMATGKNFPVIAEDWYSEEIKYCSSYRDKHLMRFMNKKHNNLFATLVDEHGFDRIRAMAYACRSWETGSIKHVLQECERLSTTSLAVQNNNVYHEVDDCAAHDKPSATVGEDSLFELD